MMHKLTGHGPVPEALREFCRHNTDCRSWEHFYHNYGFLYKELKQELFTRQGYLCAYCETKLPVMAQAMQRIEHFHPKEDMSGEHNWTFDWQNMLGVCMGGTQDRPLSDIHCDASKEQYCTAETCEGYILNPLTMPETCLFSLNRMTGELHADADACWQLQLRDNHFNTVQELVENTIRVGSKLN